jgi:maltooligosyltrehalose trehalohydrolase
MRGSRPRLGATLLDLNRCEFRVWSPYRDRIDLRLLAPHERDVPMQKNASGYHEAVIDIPAGARYFYLVNGIERPDPASRFQPLSVHGPSEVVSGTFDWHDAQWKGIELDDYVIYELHVGTFTAEGTFEAVIPKLDGLKELGVTAVELMPIGQFPGHRNWGYDGTYIGAPQSTYGGPFGLKQLIDAAHQRGLAVILDVVYNHLGPEGNYLSEFGPYFTARYKTAWGEALNFDGPQSDHVRWFFIHNALMWIDEFHIDALRVDAVHAIVDHSAEPFLQDLTTAVHDRARALGRKVHTIAESNLNDPQVITPKEAFGLGFDSQWSDDLHHSLHALLTGEKAGYYIGYGKASDLARVISQGYFYTGQYSPYYDRKYGAAPHTHHGGKFVVFAQNHDQVGNRMHGERLSTLVSDEKLRLAAAVVLLSPFLPMLFMGEEYGERAPFQYFTSHSDPRLIEAVRRGRREEFEDFDWVGETPDPHDEETFQRSKLSWKEDKTLRRFYAELLGLRSDLPALRSHDLSALQTHADNARGVVLVLRDDTLVAFNFSDRAQALDLPFTPSPWKALIDTGARVEGNRITLPPVSFAIFGTDLATGNR